MAWLIFWSFISDFSFNMQSSAGWCYWIKEISSLIAIFTFILPMFVLCCRSQLFLKLNLGYSINAFVSLFVVLLFFSNKTKHYKMFCPSRKPCVIMGLTWVWKLWENYCTFYHERKFLESFMFQMYKKRLVKWIIRKESFFQIAVLGIPMKMKKTVMRVAVKILT